MKTYIYLLSVVLISGVAVGQVPSGKTPCRRAPVYFNIHHHQEAVGNVVRGFPLWQDFKSNLERELALLDSRGIISDQYFSDFIVSVALYMKENGLDPQALQIFDWFQKSNQHLGYHFHPSTWDVPIRTDKIAGLEFEEAISKYEYWEQAYYDWQPCFVPGGDGMYCGVLDPSRLGGVQFMEQYFGKMTCAECATMHFAPVGQMFRLKYISRGQDIVCWYAGPHAYYNTDNTRTMWCNDSGFSSEPFIYTYKMMGLYFAKHTSNTFVDRFQPVSLLAQKLAVLPRDVPHIFVIHLTVNTAEHDPLVDLLDYIQNEFIPANPGSRFISAADIPDLVIKNPRRFDMAAIEEAALYFLRNYQGRPPAFVKYGGQLMSNASLFKALQAALQYYLGGPGVWPEYVDVPDFINPPLGLPGELPRDYRVVNAMTLDTFAGAVMNLPEDDTIPYFIGMTVPEWQDSLVLNANAAEFLSGMCTLFLRLRETISPDMSARMHMIPGYIVPISNLPTEAGRDSGQVLQPLDWYTDLQLWTLEPLMMAPCAGGYSKADLNGDCKVDFEDFQIMAQYWLEGSQAVQP